MKTKICSITLMFFLILSINISAQTKADKIVGYYITYNDDTGAESSQVQIFKATTGKYFGKIVWLKEPTENGSPKLDDENPDVALRTKPVIGLQILKNFTFNEKTGEWSNGSIYDPKNGKSYNCFMKFDGDKVLKIRGFIGKSWMGLGRTATWNRVEAPR